MNKRLQNYGSMSSTVEVGLEGGQNEELNRFHDEVVNNIYNINSVLKTLDNAVKIVGTSKDNAAFRERIHNTQMSTNSTISQTSQHLQKLMTLVKNSDKQKKLQIQRLMDNFKEGVAKYSTIQKHVAEKMKANLLVTVTVENPPSNYEERKLEQLQLSREISFEQEMLLERESRIRHIEEDILDVNQIMKDLSVLVHQQGETVDSIEQGIDHAVGNVEEGTEQLIQASRYSNKYRKKLCCIVVVAVVIICILIAVMFIEFKKS